MKDQRPNHEQERGSGSGGSTSGHNDDRSVVSGKTTTSKGSSGSNSNSAATAWLDGRIAQQRRKGGHIQVDSTTKDRARAEKAAAASSGVRRQKSKVMMTTVNNNNINSTRDDAIKKSRERRGQAEPNTTNDLSPPPPRMARKDSVRSALETLERDVLQTMPTTTTTITTTVSSPKTRGTTTNKTTTSISTKNASIVTPTKPSSSSWSKKDAATLGRSVGRTDGNVNGGGGGGSVQQPSTPPINDSKRLSQLEQDVEAKAMAKHNSTSSTIVTARSPAMNRSTATVNTTTTKHLSQLEEDVAAKNKARANPDSVSTGTKRLSQFEQDVVTKNQARYSPGSVSSKTTKRLSQLEQDAAAKNHARASRDGDVVTVGVVAMAGSSPAFALAHLEDQVLKSNVKGHGQQPGTYSGGKMELESTNLQNDVMVKESSKRPATRPGAFGMVGVDDERIAYKTGIPLGNDVVPPESSDKQPKASQGEKQMGIPPFSKDMTPVEGAPEHSRRPFEGPPHFPGEYDYDLEVVHESGDRLAVATAVKEEDEEDAFRPQAVEYDPDAKPPLVQNRRFRLYGALGCIALIVIVASLIGVLSVTTKQANQASERTPTSAPTCERCGLGIEETLQLAVGSEKLYNPSSPYYEGMQWILHKDPMQLDPTDENLLQRYLLATFYFETHQLGDWRSCNHQGEDDPDDTCDFLKIVGISPLAFEGIPGIRWLSDNHECSWAGIFCDELDQVRHLDMEGQAMQGTFPAVVTLLQYVQSLSFPWNDFTGTLPSEIGSMKHLLNLELQFNQFSGNFPTTWSSARNLQLINLGKNQMTGTLPPEISELTSMKGLFLFDNLFSGNFPEEMAELSLLTFLRLNANFFSSTIPSFFGNMQLNELWLQNNALEGPIPTEIGKLSSFLTDFRVSGTNIGGDIPDELWNLTDLWRLDVHNAKFTGTISPSISNLENLNVLRIQDNDFSGQLPTELAELNELMTLRVEGNNFIGSIPEGLCALRDPEGLSEITASSNMVCSCCTDICDDETGECVEVGQ